MYSIAEKESKFILHTYKRFPIIVDYAKGTRIYDTEGNSYLDFLGGIAVNVLGHCHPKVIEAINKQINRYMHLSNYFYQDVQVEFAEYLCKISGYDKVFFSNSGTEANEGALKIVRRWGNRNKKTKVIAFTNGFHGRTYGSLSLMDKPKYKDLMGPFLDGISILNYNSIRDLEASVDNSVAGVFLEFIQGEGGLQQANSEFVEKLFELKYKYNFLVVADEIQSGIFRTGDFFAFQKFGVQPDIITLAKGLGGGLPLGAILVSKTLSDIFEIGMHGTTFGGNPVACSAGLITLKLLETEYLHQIRSVSNYLLVKLNEIKQDFPSKIIEIRGRGLMLGLVLSFNATILVDKLLEEKIITNATSLNVLRLVPPLIITKSEVDEFITGLINALNKINS